MPGAGFWTSKPPPGVRVDAGHPLAQGLVACYPLNEAMGSRLNDATGRQPAATLVGTTTGWANIPRGPAVTVPGTAGNWVSFGTGLQPLGNALTVAFWVYPTNLSGRLQCYTTRAASDSGSWNIEVGAGSGGTACAGVTSSGAFQCQTVNNVMALNTWNHVVYGRRAASAGNQFFYINGVAVGLAADSPQTFVDNAADKRFGNGAGPGYFGDLRLWSRPLTASEVAALYAAPYQLFAPPVWRRYFIPAGGGVTGTGALTIRHPVLAASGTTTVVGSASLTVRHPALAATGTPTVTGSGAATIHHPTLSATGTTTVTGTGALSILHPTLAAAGTTTVGGTGALTLGHPTLAASGTATVVGTGSLTIHHPTLLGASAGTVTGTASLTIGHPTLAGTSLGTVMGTAALVVRHPTLAGVGTLTVVGSGGLTIGHPRLAGTDIVVVARDWTWTAGAGTTRWSTGAGHVGWTAGEGHR